MVLSTDSTLHATENITLLVRTLAGPTALDIRVRSEVRDRSFRSFYIYPYNNPEVFWAILDFDCTSNSRPPILQAPDPPSEELH